MTRLRQGLCALLAASLLWSGCSFPMGYRNNLVGTEEQRVPRGGQGPIQSSVQVEPGDRVVLTLTREREEEIRTVQLNQRVVRRFDLTGLAIALGVTGFALFILLIIVAINAGGSSSSSGSSDWDD